MSHKNIVLAYSGGLDTSAILVWLKKTYQAKVTAYCCDLGHLPDKNALEAKAIEYGADEFIFEDLKDTFARDFVFPTFRTGALYQNEYLLGTAIARPLIAERIALAASERKATAIAHGATGKGNDQLRFEKSWACLNPDLAVIAPWKIWDFTGRNDLIEFLKSHGYSYNGDISPAYSVDSNLLHRSCEGGVLEDPSIPYNPEEVLDWLKSNDLSEKSEELSIEFSEGIPVGVNGDYLPAGQLLETLNQFGSRHKIGLEDLIEERMNGIKSRGVYETPGGTILYKSLNKLKQLCWSGDLISLGTLLGARYGELVYNGLWHSQSRYALDAFFTNAGKSLTGTIGLKLGNGTIQITSRTSPWSLYDQQLVSFEDDERHMNKAATGYSQTVTLPLWLEGKRIQKGLIL